MKAGVFFMHTDDQHALSKKGKLQVGDRAPDFTLSTQKTGELFHLHDMLEKSNIVLYFYPKDDTPGCTAEACSFRDSYEVFQEAGAEVIGVSSDSEASHQQFASKYKLPFILLSDKNGELRKNTGGLQHWDLFPEAVPKGTTKKALGVTSFRRNSQQRNTMSKGSAV